VFVLIDNYDSFTYNLVHYFGELGVEMRVHRNDQVGVDEVLGWRPAGIVISPGPCDPDRAGICLDLIRRAAGEVPLFGVCLGHQAIGQAFGAKVVRAPEPRHGKVSSMTHDGSGVLRGIPSPFGATRYHSLTVEAASMPECLVPTAHSEDGVVMALRHRDLPIHGVQFHPESIASEHGHRILGNFVDIALRRNA